jgi:hypothetical protein
MTQQGLALAPVERTADEPTGLALVIQRLAENPQVDIGKLEKIIELQERILAHGAKAAFDAAFAAMQAELPVIAERGRTEKAKYATLEDIVEAVRPILAKHQFSLSHRTEWLPEGKVRIVGLLAHAGGHEKTSEFVSVADASGSKNAIQALGSALSYGRRYTTLDLLNIVSRYQDDDGKATSPKAPVIPDEPDGFALWADDMTSVSDEGTAALTKAWNASRADHKDYAVKYRRALTEGWKATAKRVKAASNG